MKRKVVRIDESLCDGCGLCVPRCAEGAIRLVGGKARLVADNLCDGLGACLGECPRGAITVEEREAEAFDEKAVEKHLSGLDSPQGEPPSELAHWPVKLQLVPPAAPFFRGRHLVLAADCAPVAFGDFHRRFLRGNAVAIHCPKFGRQDFVVDKLAAIFTTGLVTGVTVVRMDVPCCGGLSRAVRAACEASGRADLPVREVILNSGTHT